MREQETERYFVSMDGEVRHGEEEKGAYLEAEECANRHDDQIRARALSPRKTIKRVYIYNNFSMWDFF